MSWRKLQPSGSCIIALSYQSSHGLWLPPCRQTWPIAKPDSCLTTTVGQIYLPDLPDRPYHPDTKVVLPKRDFGVTMLASLWPRYHVYTLYVLSTQITPTYSTWSCDVMHTTSIFNRTTCEVMAPALLIPKRSQFLLSEKKDEQCRNEIKGKKVRWTALII